MGRLIDADALKAQLQREIDIYFDEDGGGIHTAMEARDEIDYAPTVDAEPVRHGRWIDYTDEGYVECDQCRSATNCDGDIEELNYCWHCGAKMDGKKNEN